MADKTLTKDELIEQIKKMSVLDLAELVDQFFLERFASIRALFNDASSYGQASVQIGHGELQGIRAEMK